MNTDKKLKYLTVIYPSTSSSSCTFFEVCECGSG